MQEQRLGYWHKIGSVPAEDIVAVDETATWEGMERKVAWSLQGKKVYRYRQKNKGQKYTLQSFQRFWGMGELSIHRWKGFELYPVINKKTVIGAISVEGVVCHKIIKGSMKKRDFL